MSAQFHHVTRNNASNRLEITVDGQTAYEEYKLSPGTVEYVHTIIPESLRGEGLGGDLFQAGMKLARDEHRKVIPTCGVIAGYMARDPDTHDLLSDEWHKKLGII